MSIENNREFKTEKCTLLPMGSGREGNDLHFSMPISLNKLIAGIFSDLASASSALIFP